MLPDSVITTAKKVVDVTAFLTQGMAVSLANTEFQHKNQFEIIFTPDSSGDFKSRAKATANAVLDSLKTKIYVQTIEVTFVSFVYERADNIQYVKDVEYPESVKMTFLETESASLRGYFNTWSKSIASINDDGTFVFEDDQIANKRNAIVIPLTKTNLPSGAWIGFKGLKFMNMESITFDQAAPENMIIEVNFACDNCWWKTPF